MKPILKQSLTNIHMSDDQQLNTIGSPQTVTKTQNANNINPLMSLMSSKKKAPSKLKPGKSTSLAKDRSGRSQLQDPCLSFGCQCTVCKSHLTKMRQGGDINAIKAFQDEVNFRQFAATQMTNHHPQQQQLDFITNINTNNGIKDNKKINPRDEYFGNSITYVSNGATAGGSLGNNKTQKSFIATLQTQQLNHMRVASLNNNNNGNGIKNTVKDGNLNLAYSSNAHVNHHSRNVSNSSTKQLNTMPANISLDNQIYQLSSQAQLTMGFKGGDFFQNAQENTSLIESSDGRIKFERQSFQWLIEHLIAPNEKICGCELWMPDTAMFDGGKPKLIVRSDKDGFIVKGKNIMNLQDLRRTFSIIVRERKKELDPFAEGIGLINSLGTQLQAQQQMQNSASNQTLANTVSNNANNNIDQPDNVASPSSKMYYKDAILIRFKNDFSTNATTATAPKDSTQNSNQEYVRVLSDTEFINEFKRRANDNFWNTIDSIQTTIKSKIGLGKPYNFTFNAPCYKKDPVSGNIVQCYDGDIDFNFKQFGTGNDISLMQNSPTAYCLKVCHKIGFYLLKIHDLQLLRMKVEFYQDEYGKIWLFNASEIWIRTVRKDSLLMQAAAKSGLNIAQINENTGANDNSHKNEQQEIRSSDVKDATAMASNSVSITQQQQFQQYSSAKKNQNPANKEERDVQRAVDKELADLIFLHKSQRGNQINLDQLRKQVHSINAKAMQFQQYQRDHDSIKPMLGQSKSSIGGGHQPHTLHALAKQQSMLAHQAMNNPKLQREYQTRKKVGDVMVNYYNNMKRDDINGHGGGGSMNHISNQAVDRSSRLLQNDQNNNINDNDSTLTDISTQNALAELRPNCPLKMQELIQREIKDFKNGTDIHGKPIIPSSSTTLNPLSKLPLNNKNTQQSPNKQHSNKKPINNTNNALNVNNGFNMTLGYDNESGFRSQNGGMGGGGYGIIGGGNMMITEGGNFDYNSGFYQSQPVNVKSIMHYKLIEKASLEISLGISQGGDYNNNQRFFSHRSISGMPNHNSNVDFTSPHKHPTFHPVISSSNYASSTPSIRNANIASTKAMTSVYQSNQKLPPHHHHNSQTPNLGVKLKQFSQKAAKFSMSGSIGNGGQLSYCPPIRHYDMPSNNPFYNGTMLNEGQLFDNNDQLPVNSTGVILKRNLDFSMMTKKQQTKIKNLLQARANYLQQAVVKIHSESHRLYDDEGNPLDLSYDELIRRREYQKKQKELGKERKDHFFKNEHVIDN